MNGLALTVLFARVAVAIGFLSAVADRLGWWGPYGTPTVAWGDMQHFMPYVAQLNPWSPAALVPAVGWTATIAEVVLGACLLAGVQLRRAAILSGCLLIAFAAGMSAGPGVKAVFNFSVLAAAGAAFLLAIVPPDPWSLDGRRRRLAPK
jgi:uncharacterized membrane protein YphA (DoxX/SURF4 family)